MDIMIKKHFYTWKDIETMCTNIVTQMYKDDWRPDYIVGITRGGNIPATIISNMTGIRCEALKVSLRDDDKDSESACWMAEDAFGYLEASQKNILIVDDINDTGATFKALKEDWQGSCLPDDPWWDQVWGKSVRFCTLTENLSSEFDQVDYYSDTVNKAEEDVWLVYPWENVSEY
jgi:hypoxanthine phosphoribosyltransferase